MKTSRASCGTPFAFKQRMLFRDRHDAGKKLANWLCKGTEPSDKVVLSLGRGGVPVAYELARALHCPFDYLGVDPVEAPGNPGLSIGAIAENAAEPVIRHEMANTIGLSPDEVEQAVLHAPKNERHSAKKFRGSRPLASVSKRDVYVVNDGLCNENCAIAAARFLRGLGAKRVIFATPIGSVRTMESLRPEFDEVICLQKVLHFSSIAFWYEAFHEVTDQRVISFLREAGPVTLEGDEIDVSDGWLHLPGTLVVPGDAKALIIFAQNRPSGSARLRQIASILNEAGLATLLFDLLTPDEMLRSSNTKDVPLLASRMVLAARAARRWVGTGLPIGYFGWGTGAAAALWAASQLGTDVFAVVSSSGRPELAHAVLPLVSAPTLLLVEEADSELLEKNRQSSSRLSKCQLVSFSENEEIANIAARWFTNSLERVIARAA